MCPTLYGFIPQTYCGKEVAARCAEKTGATGIQGDGDPMDICVLTEKAFAHGSLFVRAKPIGGLRMIDGEQADDKIIAVLEKDALDSLASIHLVLAQATISSQLIDNLNASIHLRALLTDVFLIDEILKPQPLAAKPVITS